VCIKFSEDGLQVIFILAIFKVNLCSPAERLHGLLNCNYFGINSDNPNPPFPISIQTVGCADFLRVGEVQRLKLAFKMGVIPPTQWKAGCLCPCPPVSPSVWLSVLVFWVFSGFSPGFCCSARSCLTSCTPKASRNTAPGKSRWRWRRRRNG